MIEIRETSTGKGLFATQNIKRETPVICLYIGGQITFKRTRTSIEIGTNVHVEHPQGAYMNHNMNPNCVVMSGQVVSCKDIKEGDEITSYYPQHESEISCPFTDNTTNIDLGEISNKPEEHENQNVSSTAQGVDFIYYS